MMIPVRNSNALSKVCIYSVIKLILAFVNLFNFYPSPYAGGLQPVKIHDYANILSRYVKVI